VNANAKVDAFLGGYVGVRFSQSRLRLDRALHGIHRAPELRKNTVACRICYAAPVLSNRRVKDRPAFGELLSVPTSSTPIRRL
jgi:hypothetical protein